MLIEIKLCHVTENALYCVVNGVFHRNIHSDEKLIGTPPKKGIYLDVGITNNVFAVSPTNVKLKLCLCEFMYF